VVEVIVEDVVAVMEDVQDVAAVDGVEDVAVELSLFGRRRCASF
jgi:hypothetical protein